jgi:hypothetical protein
LELKKAEVKRFNMLFGRYLRSFAMTKVDVSTGDIELELFVTNPSLKKKGYGTALLTRIKTMLPANALLWANASNCLSKPQFGVYIYFFLVCVLVECDMFNMIIFCVYCAHFFVYVIAEYYMKRGMKFVLYTDRLIELAACDNGELMYRLCFNPLKTQQVNYRAEYYDCFMYLMCVRNEEMLAALRTKTKEELTLKQWTSVLADLNRGTMARREEFSRVKRIVDIGEMVEEFKQFHCVGVDAVRLADCVQESAAVDDDLESDEELVAATDEVDSVENDVSDSDESIGSVAQVTANDTDDVSDCIRRSAEYFSRLRVELTEAIGARRVSLDRIDVLRGDVRGLDAFICRADKMLDSVEESGVPRLGVDEDVVVDDAYVDRVLFRSIRTAERFSVLQNQLNVMINARSAALNRVTSLNESIGRIREAFCGEKRLFSESSNDSL